MEIANYKISEIVTHHFGLDGGAMFGAVPKTLWERRIKADSKNRIPMLSRLLVLESGEHKILIDLGCGNKFGEKFTEIYSLEYQLDAELHEVVRDVTHVIITHLHFDHVGGVSYKDRDSKLHLSYPNAEHIISAKHWEYGQGPNPRERASFFPENLEPLKSANLRLVDSGQEVLPGISVFESFGHTKGMLWVEIADEDQRMVFAADVVPSAHHLPLPYIMGYDMCAETMIAEKEAFIQRCVDNQAIVVFEHDRDTAAARIKLDNSRAEISEQIVIPNYLKTNRTKAH